MSTPRVSGGLRVAVVGLLSAACLLLPVGAHASPVEDPERHGSTSEPAPSRPESPARWYGWKILVADAVTASLFGAAGVLHESRRNGASDTFLAIGVGSYVVGPALVHFYEGNWGRGLGSVGVRGGIPVVTGGIGLLIDGAGCNGDGCGVPGAVVGVVVGVLGAIALDAAVLAWGPASVKLTPRVASGRMELGLSGAF